MEDVRELAILKLQNKSFKRDDGKLINYKNYFVTIDGYNVSLYPKTEDKKYFNLIVDNYLSTQGE